MALETSETTTGTNVAAAKALNNRKKARITTKCGVERTFEAFSLLPESLPSELPQLKGPATRQLQQQTTQGATRCKVKRISPLLTPSASREHPAKGPQECAFLPQLAPDLPSASPRGSSPNAVQVIPEISIRRPETRVGFVLFRHPSTSDESPCSARGPSNLDTPGCMAALPTPKEAPQSCPPALHVTPAPAADSETEPLAKPAEGGPPSVMVSAPQKRTSALAQRLAALAPQLPGLHHQGPLNVAKPLADSESIGSWAARKKVYPVSPGPAPGRPALKGGGTASTYPQHAPPMTAAAAAPAPAGPEPQLIRTASTKVRRVPLLDAPSHTGFPVHALPPPPAKLALNPGRATEDPPAKPTASKINGKVEAALEEAWRHMFRRKWRREQLWRVTQMLEPQPRGRGPGGGGGVGPEYEDSWEQALAQMQAAHTPWSPQDDSESILSVYSPESPAGADEDPLGTLLAGDSAGPEGGPEGGAAWNPPQLDALRQVAAVASKVAVLQQHQHSIQQRVEADWARLGGAGDGGWKLKAAGGFWRAPPGLKASALALAA